MATTQFAPVYESQEALLHSSIWYMGGLMTIHADSEQTRGQCALVEALMRPGNEPPLHVHEHEDELVYILDGRLRVTLGEQNMVLSAGESVFLPRRIPHTFRILTERVRSLILITPGGFENYFRALGTRATSLTLPIDPLYPHISRIQGTANRFGVKMLG